MSLTLDEIAALQALGCDAYRQRVVGLFLSHRATPAHYAAMAEAVLRCSESEEGYLVEVIDRAVLAATVDLPPAKPRPSKDPRRLRRGF